MLGDNGAYSPTYLRSAYNVTKLSATSNAGAGRVVAVVDAFDNPNLFSDLNYYRAYFGMSPCVAGVVSTSNLGCVFQKVNESGQGAPLPAVNKSWGIEAAIDVEMVSALCANCQILVVDASTSAMSDLGASVNTAVRLGATVVSNSYGSAEYPSEVTDSQSYFDHPGVAVVAAAGDSGYGVQFPAASPSVVSVGGTTLTQSSDFGLRSGIETTWSGTGSGCSLYEPKPAWQHDTLCAHRTLNDVAAVANPKTGVWAYDASTGPAMFIAGGTSVSAAVVSSLYALSTSSWPVGLSPAQALYRHASLLYHVGAGANAACGTYLCDASASQGLYNGPTGVGTFGGSPSALAALSAPTDSTAPLITSVVTGSAGVTLNWSAPSASNGEPVGYDVWVSSARASATKANTVPVTNTNFVATGLISGRSYSFAVDALYPSSVSPMSEAVVATPLASTMRSGAPTGVIALAGNRSVTVGWMPPVAAVGVTSYLVHDAHGHSCAVMVSDSSVDSCTVTGLTNGKAVRFRVVARGSSGPGVASQLSSAATPAPPLGVRQLAVGLNYACAVLKIGAVECWGANASGQLGNGTFSTVSGPARVVGLSNAVNVAVGALDSCAVTRSGEVRCWGDNAKGQLGNGHNVDLAIPTLVRGVSNATQVSVGLNYSCAVTSSGAVECWGANASGQLGNGSTVDATSPVAVIGLSNAIVVQASFNHTCALLKGGQVSCWGSNAQGQLGNSSASVEATPQAVAGETSVTQVSMGYGNTCVLRGDSTVWCWGYNGEGELGQTTPPSSLTALRVTGLPAIAELSTSAYGSCAVDQRGVVWCWGYQSASELSASLVTYSEVVAAVPQLSGVKQLSGGYSNGYVCSVLSTGAVVCWSARTVTPILVKLLPATMASSGTSLMSQKTSNLVVMTKR